MWRSVRVAGGRWPSIPLAHNWLALLHNFRRTWMDLQHMHTVPERFGHALSGENQTRRNVWNAVVLCLGGLCLVLAVQASQHLVGLPDDGYFMSMLGYQELAIAYGPHHPRSLAARLTTVVR